MFVNEISDHSILLCIKVYFMMLLNFTGNLEKYNIKNIPFDLLSVASRWRKMIPDPNQLLTSVKPRNFNPKIYF